MDTDEDDIEHILETVEGRLARRFRGWAWAVGLRNEEFQDWVCEMAGVGLSVAYKDKDKWRREKGTIYQWTYLKACSEARDELLKLDRGQKLKPLSLETMPESEMPFLDSFEKALCENQALRGVMRRLDILEKSVLAHFYIASLKASQIARLLDLDSRMVYTILERARDKGRKLYAELNLPKKAKPQVTTLPSCRRKPRDGLHGGDDSEESHHPRSEKRLERTLRQKLHEENRADE